MQHRHAFSHIPFLLFSYSVFLVLAACSPINSSVRSATPTQVQTTPTPPPGKTLMVYKGNNPNPEISAAWSPDGKSIASGGFDGMVKLWDAATGKLLRTYSGFQDAFVGKIVWSHDGQRIAVGTFYPIPKDASTYVLDANSQKILLVTPKYHRGVADLAWSPDNASIASLDGQGEVHLWNSTTGEQLYSYPAHQRVIDAGALAWSPDGKFIVSSCTTENESRAEMTIWDTAARRVSSIYHLHSSLVHSLSWSADSTGVLSTSSDKTVMIWNAATGRTQMLYKGHTDEVYNAAWSPNGKLVASAGKDQTVHIFETNTGKTLFVYKEHKSIIYSVAWSPDGRLIASSDGSGTVRVWVAP